MADKTEELRELDEQGLIDALVAAKQESFNLRFRHVTGQLDNTSRLREVRKQVARINTLLRAKEIEAAEGNEKK
jgi:large subunit ribosomal protein L29